jgi:large subunit ribosomal protein L13
MLPKNKLGAMLYRNLKVYTGQEHKHQGQNPIEIKLNKIK